MSVKRSAAVVTDLERLDARLSEAAHVLREANIRLHEAEVAHREARQAVDAELRRLARAALAALADEPQKGAG